MLKIYCDGACSGNPGPGGWAFVIPERNIEQSGYEPDTTNNRMEITAVYKALEYLYKHLIHLGEAVEIITDSQYVINTMTQGWKKNKNQDLWAYIDEYKYYFTNIKWTWLKGHADNKYNQRCDELAVEAYKTQKVEPKVIALNFFLNKEFEYNNHKISIYEKVIEDPHGKKETTYYLGIVDDEVIMQNVAYPMHRELVVVQNNCMYYIDKLYAR